MRTEHWRPTTMGINAAKLMNWSLQNRMTTASGALQHHGTAGAARFTGARRAGTKTLAAPSQIRSSRCFFEVPSPSSLPRRLTISAAHPAWRQYTLLALCSICPVCPLIDRRPPQEIDAPAGLVHAPITVDPTPLTFIYVSSLLHPGSAHRTSLFRLQRFSNSGRYCSTPRSGVPQRRASVHPQDHPIS
jgi:hypothetical protein